MLKIVYSTICQNLQTGGGAGGVVATSPLGFCVVVIDSLSCDLQDKVNIMGRNHDREQRPQAWDPRKPM